MNCSPYYQDYLIQCPEGIRVNARGQAGPYAALKWLIGDKFGKEYEGEVLTDEDGSFLIPIDDLPAGLLTAYSGSFTLRILDVDNDCRPVPMLVAGYYDSIEFTVKSGSRVKDSLGCAFDCASGGEPVSYPDDVFYGDGVETVYQTNHPFQEGTEEVHVGGLLYGAYEYDVTGPQEITFAFPPDEGVEIRFSY